MQRFMRSKLFLIVASLILFAVAVPWVVISTPGHAANVTASHPMLPGLHSSRGQHTSSSQLAASGPDWPEFHGNAARDGNLSTDTVLSKANATSLVPASGPSFTTTGSAEDSPVVYQGIVYYAADNPVVTSTQTQQVSTMYAVDAATGLAIWSEQFPACGKFTTPEYTSSTAAVTTGLVNGVPTTQVFIGWGETGPKAKGCIYDFNGQTGALIWTYGVKQPVNSSPAIMSTNSGNIVVVGDGSSSVHAFSVDYTGSIGGQGVQLWSFDDTNDPPPPGYAQYCSPAPALCGDSIWSSPAEGLVMVNGTPHHYVYFGVGAQKNTVGRVDAIDLDTLVNNSPTLAWAFWDPHPLFDNDFGTILALTDANGFATRVFSGTNNGDMFGLDAVTGTMDFDFSTGAMYGTQGKIYSNGSLVTINGTTELIFGSSCVAQTQTQCPATLGYVWAIDALSTASGGSVLWRSQNFGNRIVSSPTVVNQGSNAVVYMMGPWRTGYATRGDLLALDPLTGKTIADYPVFNHAYGTLSTPAFYGGRIFVTEGYVSFGSNNPGGGGLAAFDCTAC